ncbi:hypothetical protein GF325_03305 [Candidatus Bathyarchaeota archaeon]|nr:hypothetical protein [Candidatus Bathyarchaeota archaeon]
MTGDIRIYKIFLAKRVPTWPKPDLDLNDEISRLNGILDEITAEVREERGYSTNFTGGDLVYTPADIMKAGESMDGADGLIMFNLTSGVRSLIDPVVDCAIEHDIPIIFFSQPFSGHDWGSYPRLLKFNVPVDLVASSNYRDIIPNLNVIHAMKMVQETKILYLSNVKESSVKSLKENRWKPLEDKFGVTIEFLSPEEMEHAYNSVNIDDAEVLATQWIEGAEKVIEPPREDIVKSTKLYLALKQLMEQRSAQAVTINCLGMFAVGALPAYPCLAFTILNDQGLFGVCEGDLNSTITQIIGTYMTGKPGFVTDPLFDTAKDEVIHAHCVSATCMDGINGEQRPYIIRTHMEDDKGVSLQVKMRPGQEITMALVGDPNLLLLSTGIITGNYDTDRGCRTKFGTKVRDIEKMIENWSHGLHRVIFFGNLEKEMKIFSRYMDVDIERED